MAGFVLLLVAGVIVSAACVALGYGPAWLLAWFGMSMSFVLGACWGARDRVVDPLGSRDGRLG